PRRRAQRAPRLSLPEKHTHQASSRFSCKKIPSTTHLQSASISISFFFSAYDVSASSEATYPPTAAAASSANALAGSQRSPVHRPSPKTSALRANRKTCRERQIRQ